LELCVTNDGSYTLYSEEFKEHYHSRREGALQESLYKHILPSFSHHKEKSELRILDICFGLGYNLFGTLYYVGAFSNKNRVEIISPEFDATLPEKLKNFNYPKEFDPISDIIDSVLRNGYFENKNFLIEIVIGDAAQIVKNIKKGIDIVYQDPFSPKKNPSLWSEEYFCDIYDKMNDNGILTTYSSASGIRSALQNAGFSVKKHIGEGFSKEGTLGLKNPPS